MVTSAKSEKHKNDDFLGFPKMNFKSYSSKMEQNTSTKLLGYSFHNIYNRNDPQNPLDPKSVFFPKVSEIFYGASCINPERIPGKSTARAQLKARTGAQKKIPERCPQDFLGSQKGSQKMNNE